MNINEISRKVQQNTRKINVFHQNVTKTNEKSMFFPKYAAKHKGFLPSLKNCLYNASAAAAPESSH